MSFRPLHSQLPETPQPQHQQPQARAVTSERSSHRLVVAIALLLAGMMAVLASRASGQVAKYDQIKMHPKLEDEATVKLVQARTKQFAMSGTAANASMARGYYAAYVPAKMTGPDGLQHITPLMDEARQLLSRAWRGSNPAVARALNTYILQGMKNVAEGNYHPAARINALLLLSQLDQRPADTQRRQPPIPMVKETFPILLKQYQDASNVDGVRAAALQGLHRQVMYGFPLVTGNAKTTMVTEMNQLLDSDPPAGRSQEAHAYLKRFAVDILDVLDEPSLPTKLVSISTEPKNPDLIALYSASRLSRMAPKLQGKVNNTESILRSWSKRALEACEAELTRIERLDRPAADSSQPTAPESLLQKTETKKDPSAAPAAASMDSLYGDMEMDEDDDEMGMMEDMMDMGMEMDMEMDMMGMMGGVPEAKPQPPEVRAALRKINHALQQIHLGVTGVASPGMPTRGGGGLLASVAPEERKVIQDWVEQMEPIVTALNDELLDDRTKFVTGLQEQIAMLQDLVGSEEEVDPNMPAELAPADAGVPDELAPAEEAG